MRMDDRHASRCASHAQRGVVLIIALVTSIALAGAALALVRASSAAATVGGNVHARRAAALAASAAVERAVVDLLRDHRIDPRADDLPHNYFASRQSGENARGIPRVLQAIADYPAEAGVIDVDGGYRVRHVIERWCVLPGDATRDNCALSPPGIDAAEGMRPPGKPPRAPSYRLSVRVDGASGGALHAQAILSASHANPRVSLRVLDE
jgi:hypothetical protein